MITREEAAMDTWGRELDCHGMTDLTIYADHILGADEIAAEIEAHDMIVEVSRSTTWVYEFVRVTVVVDEADPDDADVDLHERASAHIGGQTVKLMLDSDCQDATWRGSTLRYMVTAEVML